MAFVPVLIAVSALTSGVMGAVSAIKQGDAAKQAADANAKMSRENAAASLDQANADAEQQRRQSSQVIGDMKANYGASGVKMDGSALDVIGESVKSAELDHQNILRGGSARAKAYNDSANLDVMQGNNAKSNSYWGAGASILSGVGSGVGRIPSAAADKGTLKRTG